MLFKFTVPVQPVLPQHSLWPSWDSQLTIRSGRKSEVLPDQVLENINRRHAGAAAYQDEVEQCCLVNLDKLRVPLLDLVLGLGRLVIHLGVRLNVELAELNHLPHRHKQAE